MSQTSRRPAILNSRCWVIKIGSALLTDDGRGLDRQAIQAWVDQIAYLRSEGIQVVLVSSGAVAAGMQRLGLKSRPKEIHQLQAAAAAGQTQLIQCYEDCFQEHQLHTAQILLTHDDLSDRKRYLNARQTLLELLQMGVVPVVNENDTVVTEEICFGDNDVLGALVANLLMADHLIILTDQEGLYNKNPRDYPDAELISEASADDPGLMAMTSGAGVFGTGGMGAKIRAATFASRSAAATVIASGRREQVLADLYSGKVVGTYLYPSQEPLAARKRWLAGHLQIRGTIVLDKGAVKAIVKDGRSLLAVGIRHVAGDFGRGDLVACVDLTGKEVARGLSNYSAKEAAAVCGKNSADIGAILGFSYGAEVIHRDDMVITN
jgi:glutamate 5-kinase